MINIPFAGFEGRAKATFNSAAYWFGVVTI
jgi:hypothetical protein